MSDTTNFGWTKPTVGGDTDTWGTVNNAAWDAADASMKTVQTLAQQAAPTGAVQDFLATSPPDGWIVLAGSIGDASSGASSRANADAAALFELLWNSFSNTILPIYDSGGTASTRGSDAPTDFAAHKRLSLTDQPDRFRRTYKSGGSSAAIGVVQADSLKDHTHSFTINTGSSFNGSYVQPTANSVGTYTGTTGSPSTGAAAETRPTNIAYLTCIKL